MAVIFIDKGVMIYRSSIDNETVMFLVLFMFAGGVSSLASDANKKMDAAIEITSREAPMSFPLSDIKWDYSTKLFKFIPVSWSFAATGVSFWDATTVARLGDVVVSSVTDQVRLEVELSLSTMEVNYGHFELKIPLIGTFAGSGRFSLVVNSFGMSAYYGENCNRTRVYVWPPRGDPRVEIDSDWFISRVVEYLFGFLGSGLLEDVIDYDIIGDSLDKAIRQPLTKAISKQFCEKRV